MRIAFNAGRFTPNAVLSYGAVACTRTKYEERALLTMKLWYISFKL
jgi:hypothetical protein